LNRITNFLFCCFLLCLIVFWMCSQELDLVNYYQLKNLCTCSPHLVHINGVQYCRKSLPMFYPCSKPFQFNPKIKFTSLNVKWLIISTISLFCEIKGLTSISLKRLIFS
jgi:hypothetical protein